MLILLIRFVTKLAVHPDSGCCGEDGMGRGGRGEQMGDERRYVTLVNGGHVLMFVFMPLSVFLLSTLFL